MARFIKTFGDLRRVKVYDDSSGEVKNFFASLNTEDKNLHSDGKICSTKTVC